jgi:hypothetical protein
MAHFSINSIFGNPDIKHRIALFNPEHIQWLDDQLFEKNKKSYLRCLGSDKDRPAKPEENVRQL